MRRPDPPPAIKERAGRPAVGRKMRLFVLLLSVLLRVSGRSLQSYDYVVVGSGSAGAVLANRLSSDPSVRVLLLEAGSQTQLLAEVPLFYFFLQNTSYDWNLTVRMPDYPELGLHRDPASLPQGRALGGTSVINSMMYVRGNPRDYDLWQKKGAAGWGWKDVFPYFLKSENNRDPEIAGNGFHGTSGELFVQYPAFVTPLARKYLKAAEELGFRTGDVNGAEQTVFSVPQITVRDGRRWGVDKAFLFPAVGRRNLDIVTSAFVTKVLFDENKVAVAVEYEHRNRTRKAYAREEIVLSAGTVKSAQLLMLSGIGPAATLKRFGIPVVSDLPVGENFQDQPVVTTPLFAVRNLSVSEDDYKRFLNDGSGLLASLPSETIGFYRSKYERDPRWPDSEVILLTMVSSNYLPSHGASGSVLCASLAERPRSRGKVSLSGPNPRAPPVIDGGYLSDEHDLKVLVEGLKMCLTLAETRAMKSVGKRMELPDYPACRKYPARGDDYLACLVKHAVSPSYHIVGTCRMGDPKDPSTVVDPALKVKGVHGLRVADASVAPEIVVGHTHALSIMIGERAADMIKKDHATKQNRTKEKYKRPGILKLSAMTGER